LFLRKHVEKTTTTNRIISNEKLDMSLSPDGSKYPFMPGFGIKDTVDSGSEVDEKANTPAPKQKKLQSVSTLQF
jgi:hypothetical protein